MTRTANRPSIPCLSIPFFSREVSGDGVMLEHFPFVITGEMLRRHVPDYDSDEHNIANDIMDGEAGGSTGKRR